MRVRAVEDKLNASLTQQRIVTNYVQPCIAVTDALYQVMI